MKHFYSVLRREGRTAWLAGPFASKAAADAMVERAHLLACDVDQFAHFDTPGVMEVTLPKGAKAPAGRLNDRLGLPLSGMCPG